MGDMTPIDSTQRHLGNLSKHCQKLIGSDRYALPSSLEKFRPQMRSIAQFSRYSRPVDEKLADVRQLLHNVVSELGTELQIAVDGPKSGGWQRFVN
jgi:hypothetical protein